MSAAAEMTIQQPSGDSLLLVLSGSWKIGEVLPASADVQRKIESAPAIRTLAFDTQQLAGWDSGLLTFLKRLREFCASRQIRIDSSGLPPGARQLLALAAAVPAKKDARKADNTRRFWLWAATRSAIFFPLPARHWLLSERPPFPSATRRGAWAGFGPTDFFFCLRPAAGRRCRSFR